MKGTGSLAEKQTVHSEKNAKSDRGTALAWDNWVESLFPPASFPVLFSFSLFSASIYLAQENCLPGEKKGVRGTAFHCD